MFSLFCSINGAAIQNSGKIKANKVTFRLNKIYKRNNNDKTTYKFTLVSFASLLSRSANFSLQSATQTAELTSLLSISRKALASHVCVSSISLSVTFTGDRAVNISQEILIWLALKDLGWVFAINWLAPRLTPLALWLAKQRDETRRDLDWRLLEWVRGSADVGFLGWHPCFVCCLSPEIFLFFFFL